MSYVVTTTSPGSQATHVVTTDDEYAAIDAALLAATRAWQGEWTDEAGAFCDAACALADQGGGAVVAPDGTRIEVEVPETVRAAPARVKPEDHRLEFHGPSHRVEPESPWWRDRLDETDEFVTGAILLAALVGVPLAIALVASGELSGVPGWVSSAVLVVLVGSLVLYTVVKWLEDRP